MQRLFKITVNGKEYDVAVEELTSGASIMPNYIGTPIGSTSSQVSPAAPKPAAPAIQAGSGDHCAQMGGVVAGIFVEKGQSVNEGDKILELEAMKMKVPVMATVSGKVSQIHVAVGQAVVAGQPLLTIS